MLYSFLLSGAQTDPCDNEGKCPLDYATLEQHVVQFLLKALKCSVEKISTWQPENSPKIACGAFPRPQAFAV